DTLEIWLFDGDMRTWITSTLGLSFDQRNALIVGIAMGMAVIPTIFSITEDAIFAVPKHLSYGSLALGATPWQTLVGVVLPTASPGIFSALMIGMGRAVGETMIVLMATGNTPIMDANIFEGMRTLAANIAVEVPEAEVDSTHYRVLFLAAFVLFLFTFVVNTIAELVRQRMRLKYGSL
ncbi:MAG: phosphate transport system permease protein, partial [Cryomorphaceae bacterium]